MAGLRAIPCKHRIKFESSHPGWCCNAFSEVITESKDEVIYFLVHGGTIMSIFERYADVKKEYYKWYVENGHGYVADWADGQLTNIEAIARWGISA